MRVERICSYALHFCGDIGCRWDGAAEIEEAQPARGYACKEEVRGLREEAHGRDRFGGGMLLEHARVHPGPDISAWDLWLRTASIRTWLNLNMVVEVWV